MHVTITKNNFIVVGGQNQFQYFLERIHTKAFKNHINGTFDNHQFRHSYTSILGIAKTYLSNIDSVENVFGLQNMECLHHINVSILYDPPFVLENQPLGTLLD